MSEPPIPRRSLLSFDSDVPATGATESMIELGDHWPAPPRAGPQILRVSLREEEGDIVDDWEEAEASQL